MLIARNTFYIMAMLGIYISIRYIPTKEKEFYTLSSGTKIERIMLYFLFFLIIGFWLKYTPSTMNMVHKEYVGTVTEAEWGGWTKATGYGRVEIYNIALQGYSTKRIKNVNINGSIEVGDMVLIYDYESLGKFVVKLNNQYTECYLKGFRYHVYEKYILLVVISIHAMFLFGQTWREYVLKGKRKKGQSWFYLSMGAILTYIIPLWISLKYISISKVMGYIMWFGYEMYFITFVVLEYKINKEIMGTERINKNSMDLSCEKSDNENWTVNKEIGKPKSTEKDYPICQFNPVSNTLSRQYCTYRYKKEMKEWIHETIVVSIGIIALIFTVAVALEGKEILVIEAGILLFPVCVGGYYWIGKKKCRKYEQAAKDYRACESCEVTMALREKHKYIYSNGQEKIVRMERDMDGKIKDGQPAVIVYIPLADKFYTDKPETIEMIKEKY